MLCYKISLQKQNLNLYNAITEFFKTYNYYYYYYILGKEKERLLQWKWEQKPTCLAQHLNVTINGEKCGISFINKL